MSYTIDPEALKSETDEVLDALTSSVFIDKMVEFKAKKGVERSLFAMSNMTPSQLRKAGAEIPDHMRVSSRMFEDDSSTIDFIDYEYGKEIVQKLKVKRPDLWEKLEVNHPSLVTPLIELEKYTLPDEDTPLGIPLDETGKPLIDANSDDLPFDPYAAWACGCGGAATACAGAGGGS